MWILSNVGNIKCVRYRQENVRQCRSCVSVKVNDKIEMLILWVFLQLLEKATRVSVLYVVHVTFVHVAALLLMFTLYNIRGSMISNGI